MKNSKRLILKYLTGDPIAYDPQYAQLMYLQRIAIAEAAALYYKEHPEEIDKVRHGEFTYLPLPDKSKWGSEKIIDSKTGRELLPGDYVLARNGVLVTGDSLDWLDWLAETGQTLPGENLPEVHIEYNKKTGDTRRYTGLSWEDMNAQKENADIATDSLWELIALLNSDANSLINLLVQKRQADRAANARTPGIGSLALLGVMGPMAVIDPLAFTASLGAAKIGEATLDYPFQQQGYESFGDWLLGPNASESAKKNANLGTWLGGGFGYGVARGLTKSLGLNLIEEPTLLADKYRDLWRLDELNIQRALQFLNNYNASLPQFIEDVPAVEISSSSTIKSPTLVKRPGIFYSKTGELNEGSVAGATLGNWQIKALMPGNALERKVAPDGTISWKDFEWYLKQKPVEPYDRIHLLRAVLLFDKDKPIPYKDLVLASSDMIPRFTKTNSENLKGYGLDALGLGTKTDATEHYGFARVVKPNEGVRPESIVFNNPIGEYTGLYTGGRVHFPHATLHMRGYTIDNEPGVYYYLEGQSDWGLLGLKHGDFIPGSMEEHMAETSLLRGIQEALLHAAENGNSVMRIPTPETVIKSLYWETYLSPKGRELIGENSKLINQLFEDFVTTNYPELNRLRQVAIEAEHKYNMASKASRNYIRNLRSKYIIPEYVANSPEFYLHPERYLKFSEGKQIAEDIRILRQAEADALVEYQSAAENANMLLRQARRDPRALEIEEQGKLEELAIRSKYSTVDKTRQAIVNKYKAFPKHFRRLFGDKPEIRNVVDSQGNTWFEVDVPRDINTRDLIFSTLGDINEGSLVGASKGNWQIRALQPGNLLEKRLSPNGTVSWKNFNWYINSSNVSRFDKLHLLRASIFLDHDKPINYADLQKASQLLIPTFDKKFTNDYSLYGLLLTGYTLDEVNSNPTLLLTHPVIRGDRAHFNDSTVFGHLRSFSTKNEPNVIHFLESQSDRALHILNKKAPDMETLTSNEVHMAETFPLRNIQEGLLFGNDNGFTAARFPTSNTAAKIEGFSKHITKEGWELLNQLLKTFNDIKLEFCKEYYPDVYKVEVQYRKSLENTKKLLKLSGDLISKFNQNVDNFDGVFFLPWESPYEHMNLVDFLIEKYPEHKLELENIRKTLREFIASREETINLDGKRLDLEEEFLDKDPHYQGLEDQYHEDYRALKEMYSKYPKGLLLIMSRYDAFPKHFKGLFGNKNEVRNITDVKGNTWYEVDIPSDISNRNLIFSTAGNINKGSVLGSVLNAVKSLKTSLRDSMVKFGTDVLDEYYFWQNIGTDKNLLENIYSGTVDKIPTILRPKVQQGLDDAVIDELLKNTVGRRIAAFLKDEAAGLVPKSSTKIMKKGVDEARQALETVRVGLFPDLAFDLTELRVAKGFVNGPRTLVGYRDSLPLIEKFLTLVHEGDHIVDTIYPLSPTLLKVINEAFDENFLELPKRLKYYKLWGYKGMLDEATTTATEARALILNRYNIYDSTLEAQNKFISSLSDEEIFNTIENINGYGRYYIDWLRRNKKLTPEKAELFRQAMIVCAKVGEFNTGSLTSAFQKAWQTLSSGSK